MPATSEAPLFTQQGQDNPDLTDPNPGACLARQHGGRARLQNHAGARQ